MKKYYVHFNGSAVFVKDADYFESQGGLTEEWGKAWTTVWADSLEHARTKGAMLLTIDPRTGTGSSNW